MSSSTKPRKARERSAPTVPISALRPSVSSASVGTGKLVNRQNVDTLLRHDTLWRYALVWLRSSAVERLGRFLSDDHERAALLDDDEVAWKAGSFIKDGWKDATPSERQAGRLLQYCVEFKRQGNKGEGWRTMLHSAFAGLDDDLIVKGKKFLPKGKGRGQIRKAIDRIVQRKPNIKNAEIWSALKAKPPKSWTIVEDARLGRYIAGPTTAQDMTYKTFLNTCSIARQSRLIVPA